MARVILHSDMNNFYASVECLRHPEFANRPVAVCGDPEARRGIVLAKNMPAKVCGVKTGMPIWEARRACPDLELLPPHFPLYIQYAQMAREIYYEYTDLIEPFGLDEAWLDVGGSTALFGNGASIANQLRNRIRKELGLTVSIGVSFNKVFAKLGSDMKKPDATTVISPENYQKLVWRLPVEDLLFVGPATKAKLDRYCIRTIGDLAQTDSQALLSWFGKSGLLLWQYANGQDTAGVTMWGEREPVKSIGNSTTTPHDLTCETEVKIVLMALAENVAARLRENGFRCQTLQLSIRDNTLNWMERQITLSAPTQIAEDLLKAALSLFHTHYPFPKPVRALGIRTSHLLEAHECRQLSFFPGEMKRQKQEHLAHTLDALRDRFGFSCIQKGRLLTDSALSTSQPKEDPFLHPMESRLA